MTILPLPEEEDRHYRLRFVIKKLNQSFRACYEIGKYISFDEATFACVSKYLPARVFNPMKPHRYGLKVFMTCCGITGYCYGFDIYQGASTKTDASAADKKSGPQALYRAMKEFQGTWRIVICDRFYTSVVVFLQLLKIGLFAIGTIMPDRKGFPSFCTIGKDRQRIVSRGYLSMCSASVPRTPGTFLAMGWMDSKPVHLLSTGMSNAPYQLLRRILGVAREFTIPTALYRYHKFMGGVDQSDFMRMARYSVQQSYHTRKWYKSIFLSLLDLSIVNAYILHNIAFPYGTPRYKSRPDFMYSLADEMVNYVHIEEMGQKRKRRDVDTPVRSGNCYNNSSLMGEHVMKTTLPKSENKPVRNTRSKATSVDELPLMYGHTGKDQQYKDCVVCRHINGVRIRTKFYCDRCQIPVCGDSKGQTNEETGEKMLCWDVLHSDNDLKRKMENKALHRDITHGKNVRGLNFQ